MRKKILIILSLVAFLFSASVASAVNYVSGYSSVDEGEIRWGGSTAYSTQWNAGISTWNALNKINIAPDTIWTYEDLKVSDVNRSDGAWATRTGLYTNQIGTDKIELNKYVLNSKTSAQKQNTVTHELGHALGLAHSISGNVLYFQQTSQTNLGAQDISDYRYLWGY